MKKTIFVVLPLVAMLSACSQGTGTGAQGGTTLGVAAGDQETLQRVKSLQVSQNTNVNVSFPAPGVIVGALNDEVKAFEQAVFFGDPCMSLCMLRKINEKMGFHSSEQPHADAEANAEALVKDVLTSFDYAGQGPVGMSKSPHPFIKTVVADAKSGSHEKIKEHYERFRYAQEIIGINRPNNGWRVPVMSNAPEDVEATENFIKATHEQVEFANLVLTELASMLTAGAWRDPAAAKEAALIAWRNIPIQKLRDAWATSEALPYRGATVDGTGHKGMHWTSAENGDFVGDGAGWTVIKNGAPWYGSGYLSGRQVTVALASAISASQSQQSGNTTSAGNNSSMDAGSNSQVK